MRPILSLLIRIFSVFCVVSVVAAIGIGRQVARPQAPRHLMKTQYQEINSFLFSKVEEGSRFLDSATGRYLWVNFPAADWIQYGSCSPWRDDQGQSQVVGRWVDRQSHESGEEKSVGLARFKFPSGELIERVPLDVVPTGLPCWFPGTAARILFTAADGQIYHLAFESRSGVPTSGEDREARPLAWKCAVPGLGSLQIKDLVWPTAPGLKGRLLASLSYLTEEGGKRDYVKPQLWWLQLDEDATAIVAADRLIVDPAARSAEDRLPNLTTTPEGRMILAYLSKPSENDRWQLRIAPVDLDDRDGIPHLDPSASRVAAVTDEPVSPTFSVDGRSIYGVLFPERSSAQAERFSVAQLLKADDGNPVRLVRSAPEPPSRPSLRLHARRRFRRGPRFS